MAMEGLNDSGTNCEVFDSSREIASQWSYEAIGNYFWGDRSDEKINIVENHNIQGNTQENDLSNRLSQPRKKDDKFNIKKKNVCDEKEIVDEHVGVKSDFKFEKLTWRLSPDSQKRRIEIIENRIILSGHILAPWVQESSLLGVIKESMAKICKESVLCSPDLLELKSGFVKFLGKILHYCLIPEKKKGLNSDSKDILSSFAKAVSCDKMMSRLIVKSSLEHSLSELRKKNSPPFLTFNLTLMDKVPVVFMLNNDKGQKYYIDGLPPSLMEFPDVWMYTYQPYFYHLFQTIAYWAHKNNFTESFFVSSKYKENGFSLFSLMNLVLCSFLRSYNTSQAEGCNSSLFYLLLDFFAFVGSFRVHDTAVCLSNSEQNYVCKRSPTSVAPENDFIFSHIPSNSSPSRLQVLSPVDWRQDLTTKVTVSRKLVLTARNTFLALIKYATHNLIDESCELLRAIFFTSKCIQNRRLDVATCNKILKG